MRNAPSAFGKQWPKLDENQNPIREPSLLRKFPGAGVSTATGAAPIARQVEKPKEADKGDQVATFVADAAGAPRLLLPTEVAALLGVGVRTLERWRSTGEGPRYIRLSRKTIRYQDASVQAFIASSDRANTAQ
jgi:predicted DNA-binding transcriptional regulator AlpA